MATIRCKSAFLMRSDTSENWKNNNPVLRQGEEGYETDTGKRKVGDGSAEWKKLPYCDDTLFKAIDDSAEQLTSKIATTAAEERILSDNTYSNALKGSVSGAVLNLGDVSPLKHNMSVRIRNKNLIPYPFTGVAKTINGTTITDNGDGTISMQGTATADFAFEIATVKLSKGSYHFSCHNITNNTKMYASVVNAGEGAYYYDRGKGVTFTVDKTINYAVSVSIKTTLDLTETMTIYPQLERGTTKTEFTPYISDLTEVKVSRYGRNLIPFPYLVSGTVTQDGVTINFNNDGTFTVSGTSTADVWLRLNTFSLPKGTYKFTGCPTGANASTYLLRYGSSDATDANSELIISDDTAAPGLWLYIKRGNSLTDTLFKPQIEFADTASDYEPYIEPTTYTPLTDGTVEGVESLYPTTTLLTDTDGVVIDCEYNKDINKAYAQLLEKVSALAAENTNN